jgi:hypothetical protein
MGERYKEEGKTYSDILLRPLKNPFVVFELLIDYIRVMFSVDFSLDPCSALNVSLYTRRTNCEGEWVFL